MVRYFDWLVFKVTNEEDRNEYSQLLDILYKTPFTALLERDSNRVSEVRGMREDFKDEADFMGEEFEPIDIPVSLLEVMVVLSCGAESIMQGFDDIDNRRWFAAMLQNSGLVFYNNDNFDEREVNKICYRIIFREYGFHGEGGLFYIPNLPERLDCDLKDVELWQQLMWYISFVFEEY